LKVDPMFKPALTIALIALSAYFACEGHAKAVAEHIYIVPVGDADSKVVAEIKDKLPSFLSMSSNTLVDPGKDLPESAYDSSRKQYNARVLLKEISRRVTVDTANERVLLITDVDLYMPETDFVFGLADAKRGICVISSARLKDEFYGLKPNKRAYYNRALKEAAHELGHSWDLGHCTNPKCVMCLSNTLADIDKQRDEFCHACRDKLRLRYEKALVDTKALMQRW